MGCKEGPGSGLRRPRVGGYGRAGGEDSGDSRTLSRPGRTPVRGPSARGSLGRQPPPRWSG